MNPVRMMHGEDILNVSGDFPVSGDLLPSFMLVDDNCNDIALEQFAGEYKVILTLLSHDEVEYGGSRLRTATRRFFEKWPAFRFICISVDSPSTLRRVRKEHGLPGTVLLSTLRGRDFHKHYGVLLKDFPLAGYTAPALFIADDRNRIIYSECVRDTLDEFNYGKIDTAVNAAFEARAEEERKALEAHRAKFEGST